MDKIEFLEMYRKYNGKEREMYIDCGDDIIEDYKRLISNGDIAKFHGFMCMVEGLINKKDDTYALIPYSGSQEELQNDKAFIEYHYWRAVAKKGICKKCGIIYFYDDMDETCPYCWSNR